MERGRLPSRTKERRLQKKENSSWKKLSECEITLKVGTGEMVSAKAVGDLKYGIHLSKELCPKTPQEVEDMSNIPYASAIGSLMYAMLCTKPNICYSVGRVSRYQSNPGRCHTLVPK
ncbi:gag/pol protein [Cucumis melo var. makuwa]|uniref:Gag/pol protein n=1 Tax=Cucumis melo var. makuwa TaxID=1194695 RepID=A0A5A7T4Z5_CUCMM|nr:gag/pol protein [Cucumis melo var. makuwa]